MHDIKLLLVFTVDKHEYALPYSIISKVVNAVEITPVPNLPDIISGIINVHGQVVPVINIRKKIGAPDKEIQLTDKYIITKTSERTVALIVDDIKGLIEPEDKNIIKMKDIVPNPDLFTGTVKLKNNLILIYNTDSFLSLEDNKHLEQALGQ